MNKIIHILILHSLFFISISSAQSDSSYLTAEDVLEEILQEPGEEEDHSDFYDNVEQFLLNPININDAQIKDLLQIPEMDYQSAKLIVTYKDKYGNFFSTDELNAVQGLDNDLIKQIKPFITVGKVDKKTLTDQDDETISSTLFSRLKVFSRNRISNDLQLKKGFIDNKFTGTKPKIYNRLLLKYNDHYQLGFLIEKDAGEKAFNDFQSYHLSIHNMGILQNLIIGYYLLEFGHGLVMWNPYSTTKGTDINYIFKKKTRVCRPYTSATETNYLRGASVSIKVDDFTLTGFYSHNLIDANLDTISGNITSVPIDGLHRTDSELNKRSKVDEKVWGARADYSYSDRFYTGLLYTNSNFSNNFQGDGVFDINGCNFNYYSTYYDLLIDRINIFGEIAFDGTSVASINSFQIFLGSNLTLVTSIRSYPRNYISYFGNAFGEKSGATKNEFGIFTGLKWKTFFGIINFYYDNFKFPYATYTNPMPTTGNEFLINFIFKPLSKFETIIRYKHENKEITVDIENQKQLVKRLKQQPKLELVYYPSRYLRLKGRFEYSYYQIPEIKAIENGYLVYQDIRFTPLSVLIFYARIIFFSTDSFNSAIYEFENDLNGVMTNRPLYGSGTRWYLMLKYKPFESLELSLKYAEIYKPDEKTIATGLNEINGNMDNNISFQIDIKY